ncbi:ArnT family glycosyltransferase [Chitinophaga nivalis]|uniref:Glycosyltransferase family 39 protein n=1 Tax=Chitinophaga nivalis TaxID=2991709 RepID=A0ABT3IUW1_9BACT|nr:glycosyltransferase family 39 protein [Chitinophaga nivalis]MCW3462576.1 glycosyltransferase family 39 protein [Chitinophaga nivalis]MCW3487733.1 glycosyltransferase family 39 protein [Chitinophaga nivalis]
MLFIPTTRSGVLTEKQVLLLMTVTVILLQFSALFVPILEPDGALYAGIAKTMVLKHDYLNLYADGHDWLDKPHFPFWMAALSFRLFGIHTWSYKLPAILFLLMGAWYTYRFALSLYGEKVACWAVCILLTAEHLVISNNDVRAEPYLTGLIIAAVYYFYRQKILPGALFLACAIMTKGMFAIVPVGAAIGGHLLFTRNWKALFHLRWVLALLLTALFIIPELYALYQQFDLHPEKVVFGHTGVSGLRFFFWDSQFGRFMNTGPIKGAGDPFFFFHTLLWAFLPWSILLYTAIILFVKRWKQQQEYYCICAGLATFALFSLSKFQLPHYLNIIFPFFAILTAKYILSIHTDKGMKFYRTTQYTIIILIAVAGTVIDLLYKPAMHYAWLLPAGALILLYILLHYWLDKTTREAVFYRTVAISILLNLYLNTILYPDMMQYQSGSSAAVYANNVLPETPVSLYQANSYGFDFYLKAPVNRYDSATFTVPAVLFTTPEAITGLQQQGYTCTIIKTFPHFYVSKLDLPFVRKATRASALVERSLVRVEK